MRGLLGGRGPDLRVRRHLALRGFAGQHGWDVLGMVADLSTRYPVPDLVGAPSAQAELAVQGAWRGQPATVALVAARPPARDAHGRRQGDRTVLLVALDSGPRQVQLVAEVTGGQPEVAVLGDGPAPAAVVALLGPVGPVGRPRPAGRLRPGDHVVLGEVDLVLARTLARHEARVDPAVLLDLLVDLLDAIDTSSGGPRTGRPPVA
ncbi:hypothetical protein [Aquipuribacter hungaricus]|uniref:Uncharacterized protein n=1 Tax=Aquipuribacter hungaricus TaxID=545624 RepID=A0ABV7WK19_9MICO